MPNGKSGDHPVTDIVIHHRPIFSPTIDGLVVELDGLGLWTGAIAWEWMYTTYWDWKKCLQTGGEVERQRFLDHMFDVLSRERSRLSRSV